MVVHEVEHEVDVSVDGLVVSQLWLHLVQPVYERLQCLCELAREQQRLLQLVLSGRALTVSTPTCCRSYMQSVHADAVITREKLTLNNTIAMT